MMIMRAEAEKLVAPDVRRAESALPYTLHPQGEGSTSIYYLVQRGGASPMATSLLDCIRSPRVREMIVRELAVFARTGLACSDGWMGS